jgi:hypothetical protein
MSKRSYAFVLIVAAVIVIAAVSMRGQSAGRLHRWMAAMHGSR